MSIPRKNRAFVLLTAAVAAVLVSAAAAVRAVSATDPVGAQRKPLRWATASPDSYGYEVAAAMAKILDQALGGEHAIQVNPYASTTGAMKAVMDGNGEIGYTAEVGMTQLYAGEGAFRHYIPIPPSEKLVHALYVYPMESFMAAPAKTAGQFKCWGDLSDKPVFFTTTSTMNWLNFQRIYKALGYQFRHVPIQAKWQAEALQAGTIAGAVAYTTAGRALPPYWKETELRTEVRVINPCPHEVEKLKAAGLQVAAIDPKNAFSKDVGAEEILGVPLLFAYNVRPSMPEDIVYRMVTAFHRNKDKLAQDDPGFTDMARDFIGMQVRGINANPDIPVHPGLAKFLKEQKAWNDRWKIASNGS
jgi:TRAP transporter TAXI family solute receptor